MSKISVFYSFHFGNDVMRTQQIRNIGIIEGNSTLTANNWESIKRVGDYAVRNWIDTNMRYKRCLVVLIGEHTADRKWVKYEIESAYRSNKAIIGIHIHNINCPRLGKSRKGKNPFTFLQLPNGQNLSSIVPCYDPYALNAYSDIAANISVWINKALKQR